MSKLSTQLFYLLWFWFLESLSKIFQSTPNACKNDPSKVCSSQMPAFCTSAQWLTLFMCKVRDLAKACHFSMNIYLLQHCLIQTHLSYIDVFPLSSKSVWFCGSISRLSVLFYRLKIYGRKSVPFHLFSKSVIHELLNKWS